MAKENDNDDDETESTRGITKKKRRRNDKEDDSSKKDLYEKKSKKKTKKKTKSKKRASNDADNNNGDDGKDNEEASFSQEGKRKSPSRKDDDEEEEDDEEEAAAAVSRTKEQEGKGKKHENGMPADGAPTGVSAKGDASTTSKMTRDDELENHVNCNEEYKNAEYDDDNDDDDGQKVFVSRIPQAFKEESIRRSLQAALVNVNDKDDKDSNQQRDHVVTEVALVYARDEHQETTMTTPLANDEEEETPHRGFAFVTLSSKEFRDAAIRLGTIKGTARPNSKRKYTLYIRPILREASSFVLDNKEDDEEEEYPKDICYQWVRFRCPHGQACKFLHVGSGGCLESSSSTKEAQESGAGTRSLAKTKKKTCLNFRKRGKCSKGDACPYLHDKVNTPSREPKGADSKKGADSIDVNRHCFRWQTTGKCRQKDKTCPYRHDPEIREAALAQQTRRQKKAARREEKKASACSVRVFGLPYDTTANHVRDFFQQHLGATDKSVIRRVDFPTFEDSGRSRGYCGLTFGNRSTMEKALQLDGAELHGRWLRVQEGRMLLREWQQREEEAKRKRPAATTTTTTTTVPLEDRPVGEFGQWVKRRKRHGFPLAAAAAAAATAEESA